MNSSDKLVEIVGSENFSDDPKALDTYSKDFSLTPPGAPNCVVKPKTAEEVQKVIKFANENSLPVVPVSSWVHFHGATIPKQGGIILDLTRMNRIFEVDELNRRVRMEVGVTWDQITSHLAKKRLQNNDAAITPPPALGGYRPSGERSHHQYGI